MNKKNGIVLATLILLPLIAIGFSNQQQKFINRMVMHHHFKKSYITKLMNEIKIKPEVIEKMTSPYEAQPWYKYQKLFLTKNRITKGVKYWHDHKKYLQRAEKKYGVPCSIITAIVGVESKYGKQAGTFSVLNSLATLAFVYPPRAPFFQSELEQYLVLSREQHFNPKKIVGSYAGALGFPQFMPSSYRTYAVDFNNNNKIDLLHDTADVIGSIGNYLHKKGWQHGKTIVVRAKAIGTRYKKLTFNLSSKRYRVYILEKYQIKPAKKLPKNSLVNLVRLKNRHGYEIWLGLHNFYVITRYNQHVKYALIVCQLAQKIQQAYEQKYSK